MPITIRKAGNEDAALIADLSRQTFYDTFAADNRPEDMEKFMNVQFTRQALMAEVGAKNNIFLLASEGGEALGYARLRENTTRLTGYVPALEIARIYVLKNQIGKGAGAALMRYTLDLARQMDKKLVWLGVWEKNLRAIAFYQHFGFSKFAETDFLLGNDLQKDWLMKKELD